VPTLGPRIVVAGTHSGVGKTTVTTGLLAALRAGVDIGPIEHTDHYWGIVGSIPYDGHVVLAVIGSHR
jgi:hypothetical protein